MFFSKFDVMKTTLFIFYCLLGGTLCAQDMAAVEKDLVKSFVKINYWWEVSRGEYKINNKIDADSMQWKCDSDFIRKLLYYTNKYHSSLTYPFKILQDSGVGVLTSADSLFRIYNWNTQLGGTEVFYNTIFQYKVEDGVKAYSITGSEPGREGVSPDFDYDTIYTFKANTNTYYIVPLGGKYSTKDYYDAVKIYSIANGKLNDTVHLIKTKTGIKNSIGYDYILNFEDPEKDFYVHAIHFNPNDSIIYIPLVTEEGRKTNRFIRYKFTGRYFEKMVANEP